MMLNLLLRGARGDRLVDGKRSRGSPADVLGNSGLSSAAPRRFARVFA
jgi:hypothetical protein